MAREVCEILWRETLNPVTGQKYWYEAIAIGSRGRYLAAKSGTWRAWGSLIGNDGHNGRELDALISELVNDGWSPLGSGPNGLPRFDRQR